MRRAAEELGFPVIDADRIGQNYWSRAARPYPPCWRHLDRDPDGGMD